MIKEENQYTAALTRHSKPFQQQIYKDLLRHMKQTDASVPYPWEGCYYYSRTVEGKSYSYVCRRRGSMDAPEEMILDLNALAKGEKYLDVGEWSLAPGAHALLAYSVDTTGYEVWWREGGREGQKEEGLGRRESPQYDLSTIAPTHTQPNTTALSLTHTSHTRTQNRRTKSGSRLSQPGRARGTKQPARPPPPLLLRGPRT